MPQNKTLLPGEGANQAAPEPGRQDPSSISPLPPLLRAACRRCSLLLRALLIAPIRGYQYFISPFLAPSCRFTPSCSQYAIEAIREHGALRGGWLACKRLLRCRPGGGCGLDPVPPRDAGRRAKTGLTNEH